METRTTTTTSGESRRRLGPKEGGVALVTLLAIQIFVGYEWLMSGLAKIVRGGFPSGLADELTEKSEGIGGWYKDFLDDTVIPDGELFGVLIILGELIVGFGLIAAAAVWLVRRETLGDRAKMVALGVTFLAAVGATFMNVAFHLANGSAHPWLIPEEGFDEGVDLDSLMPLIQLALAAFSAKLFLSLRRERAGGTSRGALAATASSTKRTAKKQEGDDPDE